MNNNLYKYNLIKKLGISNKGMLTNPLKCNKNSLLFIRVICLSLCSLIIILLLSLIINSGQSRAPGVFIKGRSFYQKNGTKIDFLTGMNIIVKGPPWIPDTFGNQKCNDSFCRSFTQADINHLKNITNPTSFNAIRLSTIWAGAQPNSTIDGLDIEFKDRLRNITRLCHQNNIYILFDIHQDVLSSVYCGERGAFMDF